MPDDRGSGTPVLTLLGGGLAIAVLTFLGLVPRGQETPNPGDSNGAAKTGQGSPTFASVDGTISLPSYTWDDPFAHQEIAKQKALSNISDVKTLINNELGSDGRIMYLVVPVEAGNDPARVESRRRRRHAVELAAANQGFHLSYPDRMTYRKACIDYRFLVDEETPATSLEIHLPTKLYKHKSSDDYMLVTWIQESHLGKRPLDVLRQVTAPIVPKSVNRRAAFCVLGPSFSDTLRDLIRNCDRSTSEDAVFFRSFGRGATVCNCTCTATNRSLELLDGQKYVSVGEDAQAIRLIHTIASDHRLVDALVRELTLRGVMPSGASPGELVLFAEQGSLSYINDLQAKFLSAGNENSTVVIPYLQRIAAAGGSAERNGSSSSSFNEESVKDYLDRSMSDLGNLEFSRDLNPRRVRAVGLIGWNWEDKNLIMEKARDVFPVATFFTTELDARYSLPEFVSHNRNLIVASHYGLRVNGRSDIFGRVDSIPSFRDGYQTSSFIGMSVLCRAFRAGKLTAPDYILTFGETPQDLFDLVGRDADTSSKSQAYLRPLTFEIGSHRAVQLPTQESPRYLPLRQPPGVRSIHENQWLVWEIFLGLAALILVFNFLSIYSADLSKMRTIMQETIKGTASVFLHFLSGEESTVKRPAVWPVVAAVLIGAVVLLVMVLSDASNESEPILLSEGISIWPAIWGLCLVITLSIRQIAVSSREMLSPSNDRSRIDPLAVKLAVTILTLFYVASYLESGFIQPPARDWSVRLLASAALFLASFCVLFVACKSFLFSLDARKVITEHSTQCDQREMVKHCRQTMHLSIDASKKLLLPAGLSVLFIASRWRQWDAWGLDISWYVLLVMPIILSFAAAVVVRLTAIKYRNDVVEMLRQNHYELICKQSEDGQEGDSQKQAINLLEQSEEEITRLNRGPFGPLSSDYLLGAAALVATIILSGPAGLILSRLMPLFA